MFDIGFSELIIIGIVALVVVGPERLPKVARTAGHLFGRFQRYVGSVKADLRREIEFDELEKAHHQLKADFDSARNDIAGDLRIVEKELDDVRNEIEADATTTPGVAPEAPRPQDERQQQLEFDPVASPPSPSRVE